MSELRKKTSNTIAFHYIDSKDTDPKAWFYFMEKWFEEQGYPATRFSGKGRSNINFKNGKRALEKDDFGQFETQAIWIGSVWPDNNVGLEYVNCYFSTVLDCHRDFKRNVCHLCWDDSILPATKDLLKELVKKIESFCKPKYGYFFQMPFGKGPLLYADGSLLGNHFTDKERSEINNWNITGLADLDDPDYKPHMIRDIYPFNFLSPQHLKGDIGDITLEQWILKDPSHGTLEEIAPNFWCWSVEEENIQKIREALRPQNVIIAFMDF